MTVEAISALVNLGSAGAVIIVVAYFLKFIEKRDQTTNETIKQVSVTLEAVRASLEALTSRFEAHDEMERAVLLKAADEPKTQPKRRGAND